jgi:hypothetical protein
MSVFHCCEPRRLELLKHNGSANAIEFLEVLDKAAPPGAPRQQTLFVRLLHNGFTLTPDNIRITGGERIRNVHVLWCAAGDALPAEAEAGLVDTVDELPRTLVVRTDSSGDYSNYSLSIVAHSGTDAPPAGFDLRLSSVQFSFKVECPSDFDCLHTPVCPPAPGPRPEIDYLAKDYQGFRRLMLDRLSLLMPGRTERSAADFSVMLVELLAYAADNLSYRQDAIANEAYLATARQRVSVRRHARLVDYYMHEGCNARAFVHFEVNGQQFALPARSQLLTKTRDLATVIAPGSEVLRNALRDGALVFETAHDATLDDRLNELPFYTWGDNGCCLQRGATSATLRGHFDMLRVGDILVFEEIVSPTTFNEADADPAHRWAVRLTRVTLATDDSGQLFDTPPVDGPVDITEIAWDAADALPFPLCISVTERPGLAISVAHGNIVLVDHGLTVEAEDLGEVPQQTMRFATPLTGSCCAAPAPAAVPLRFRPSLEQTPLTHGFDLGALLGVPVSDDEAWWPASSLLQISPAGATPRIALTGTLGTTVDPWRSRRDLLASDDADTHFVVEIEDSGHARLRFGDDVNGKRPDPGTGFVASYRVGNGVAGNVGAEAISAIVSASSGVFENIRNPLPAAGGVDPEDIEVVRRDAPYAFRTQERAVTPADYAAAAERRPDVQRAAAKFRWTGSWYTAFITADRFGGLPVDDPFETRLRRHLERFRMAGYDLEVNGPTYVPLDIALHICVLKDYFRADVLQAVRQVLSSDVLPDGRLGLFHPDNFTFAQPVFLSRIIAAAQAVEGVDAVRADVFRRLVNPSATSLDLGVITMGGLEIAQLANSPSFPERGRLILTGGGGK